MSFKIKNVHTNWGPEVDTKKQSLQQFNTFKDTGINKIIVEASTYLIPNTSNVGRCSESAQQTGIYVHRLIRPSLVSTYMDQLESSGKLPEQ